MQVRVDIYFRIATSDTQVKFEKGHRETEKQKNKEKKKRQKQKKHSGQKIVMSLRKKAAEAKWLYSLSHF